MSKFILTTSEVSSPNSLIEFERKRLLKDIHVVQTLSEWTNRIKDFQNKSSCLSNPDCRQIYEELGRIEKKGSKITNISQDFTQSYVSDQDEIIKTRRAKYFIEHKLFLMADKDRDKYLNLEELINFMNLRGTSITRLEGKAILSHFDPEEQFGINFEQLAEIVLLREESKRSKVSTVSGAAALMVAESTTRRKKEEDLGSNCNIRKYNCSRFCMDVNVNKTIKFFELQTVAKNSKNAGSSSFEILLSRPKKHKHFVDNNYFPPSLNTYTYPNYNSPNNHLENDIDERPLLFEDLRENLENFFRNGFNSYPNSNSRARGISKSKGRNIREGEEGDEDLMLVRKENATQTEEKKYEESESQNKAKEEGEIKAFDSKAKTTPPSAKQELLVMNSYKNSYSISKTEAKGHSLQQLNITPKSTVQELFKRKKSASLLTISSPSKYL